MTIAGEVLRGRFRKGFEPPPPVAPNEVNEYVIPLHGSDHTFRRGHKIMVQVQSTWFPVIDRNPQKYVENIFTAQESDFQVATQRVYRSSKFASHAMGLKFDSNKFIYSNFVAQARSARRCRRRRKLQRGRRMLISWRLFA